MQHVEAIATAPIEDSGPDTEETVLKKLCVYSIITSEEEIALFHYSDDVIQRKITILKKDKSDRTASEMNDVRDYKLKDGLLYKTVKLDADIEVDLCVAPQSMRKTLVIKYHDLRSHPGTEKTVRNMVHFNERPGYLHPISPGKRPFDVIHTDHLGPFITSNRGNKYVLAMIDNLTKFVQLEAVRNTKVEATVRSFTATRFREFCDKHGVKHTLNSSRHPQVNGLVEQLNATILPMMRISIENSEGRDWDKYFKKIERDINTFEEGPLRYLTTDNETYLEPKHMQDNARKCIADMQSKYKERNDQHRYEDPEEEMNQTDEMEETDAEEEEDGVRNCNERSRRKANKPKYLEDYTE
ncbi:hypothetical protein Trydic_g1995 [Trypoxylus dichotomus]